MKRCFFFFVTLLLLPAATADPLLRSWEDPIYVEQAFIEVAFKREYDRSHRLFHLNRWQRPIYYEVRYYRFDPQDYQPMLEQVIHQVFTQIRTITGHPIREASADHPPNFRIILTRENHYQDVLRRVFGNTGSPATAPARLARTTNCTGRYLHNSRGEIYQGDVIIPVDKVFRTRRYVSCVTEEITQVMGLPNDSDWVTPSLANDSNTEQIDISPLDYVFLKLLYHPRLQPGMRLSEAQGIIRALLRQWKREGMLQAAPARIRHIRRQSHAVALELGTDYGY